MRGHAARRSAMHSARLFGWNGGKGYFFMLMATNALMNEMFGRANSQNKGRASARGERT